MGIFATLQYSEPCMDVQITSNIQIHTFSLQADEYLVAMYFLVFQQVHTDMFKQNTLTFT